MTYSWPYCLVSLSLSLNAVSTILNVKKEKKNILNVQGEPITVISGKGIAWWASFVLFFYKITSESIFNSFNVASQKSHPACLAQGWTCTVRPHQKYKMLAQDYHKEKRNLGAGNQGQMSTTLAFYLHRKEFNKWHSISEQISFIKRIIKEVWVKDIRYWFGSEEILTFIGFE